MREASKTNQYRNVEFFSTYLGGSVLDIGAGKDLVCPHAKGFDISDGDANNLDYYFAPHSFDTVHSSHCLEHMFEPVKSLTSWWRLVKPGGYLIIVVPDEDLYEQGIWPSVFNSDHKSTFRLGGETSWSPVSQDLHELCRALDKSEIISAEIQSYNYDYNLIFPRNSTVNKKYPYWMKWLFSFTKRLPGKLSHLERKLKICQIKYGYPFDQTKYDASAQIEVIVRKRLLS